MKYDFKGLYNTPLINNINSLCEMIDEIYDQTIDNGGKPRWTKDSTFNEYGFYLDNKKKNLYVYCGIWYEMWELRGVPICMCLDGKKKEHEKLSERLKSICEQINDKNVQYVNYDGYPTLIFMHEYFEQEDCVKKMVRLIKDLHLSI